MAPKKISAAEGEAAVSSWRTGEASLDQIATAVRYTLQQLGAEFPGHTLEVRVPPYGAVQCVEGPRHTRGTPPNVVEMSPETWLSLATGSVSWADALSTNLVSASGTRASLDGMVPLLSKT